jgi:hypothetical protein
VRCGKQPKSLPSNGNSDLHAAMGDQSGQALRSGLSSNPENHRTPGAKNTSSASCCRGFEAKLDPDKFVRIHRSIIVNLDSIKSLHTLFNCNHVIVLKNGQKINSSPTYHEKLKSLLAW